MAAVYGNIFTSRSSWIQSPTRRWWIQFRQLTCVCNKNTFGWYRLCMGTCLTSNRRCWHFQLPNKISRKKSYTGNVKHNKTLNIYNFLLKKFLDFECLLIQSGYLNLNSLFTVLSTKRLSCRTRRFSNTN